MSTRSSPQSQSYSYKSLLTSQGGEELVLSEGSGTERWTDTVTFGDNIPGWRDLLRSGQSATTSMVGSRIKFRYTPGHGKWVNPKGGHPNAIYSVEQIGAHGINMSVALGNPGLISTAKADAEALGRFNRRVREKLTAFQGGVFLGELRQTLQTIRNPARGLRNAADDFLSVARRIRKGGLSGATARNASALLNRTTQNLADAWLEVQFGWKPLLHDIDDGCKALAILNTGQSLSTGRCTASFESEENPTETSAVNAESISAWQVRTVTVDRCLVIYRGALRAEALNPAGMEARLLGFDPSNFLPTVWELIPYSFLIDYFTNIGDIVEGWSQIGTRLAWCNRTVRSTLFSHSYSRSDLASSKQWTGAAGNLASVTFVPAESVIEKTLVSRNVFTGFRIPDFTFRVPGSGSLRWLNIAALIASRQDDRNWSYGD